MKSLKLLLTLVFAGAMSTAMVQAGDKAECKDTDTKQCCTCKKDKDGKECGKDKPCCCVGDAPKSEKTDEAPKTDAAKP